MAVFSSGVCLAQKLRKPDKSLIECFPLSFIILEPRVTHLNGHAEDLGPNPATCFGQ